MDILTSQHCGQGNYRRKNIDWLIPVEKTSDIIHVSNEDHLLKSALRIRLWLKENSLRVEGLYHQVCAGFVKE